MPHRTKRGFFWEESAHLFLPFEGRQVHRLSINSFLRYVSAPKTIIIYSRRKVNCFLCLLWPQSTWGLAFLRGRFHPHGSIISAQILFFSFKALHFSFIEPYTRRRPNLAAITHAYTLYLYLYVKYVVFLPIFCPSWHVRPEYQPAVAPLLGPSTETRLYTVSAHTCYAES